MFPFAQYLERHDITDEPAIQRHLKLAAVLHSLAVNRQHQIAWTKTRACGHASRQHVREDDAGVTWETKTGRKSRGERLRANSNVASAYAARLADLFVDGAHDIARRREGETFIAGGSRGDERVDPHEPAPQIDQRSTTTPRIDGRIGLDVDHRRLGFELPCDRADDAKRDRVTQSERAAEGDHELTGFQVIRVTKGKSREVLLGNLQDRQIRFDVETDNFGRDDASAVGRTE